ncbi:MAG TPA: prepilin-type N-terminal cleavage/methylation domain-containing protein [Candidatus Binatia bacterium]|jgi:prepilin-type N-terminal cleavage/methylation domain-containing protein|nr:prepilin-type N-terminal cleavage/methylation domain-containing protein [Candidatus Binatia bacterium]
MRFQNSNFKSPAGFTLLEVVVAMTIVGLGVVTLLEIFSLGLRLSARSSDRTEAMSHSRSVMDGLLIRRKMSEGGEEGPFGDKGRWRLQVKSFRDDTQLLSPQGWELKEITLEVPYSGESRNKQLELKTLRLFRKENR